MASAWDVVVSRIMTARCKQCDDLNDDSSYSSCCCIGAAWFLEEDVERNTHGSDTRTDSTPFSYNTSQTYYSSAPCSPNYGAMVSVFWFIVHNYSPYTRAVHSSELIRSIWDRSIFTSVNGAFLKVFLDRSEIEPSWSKLSIWMAPEGERSNPNWDRSKRESEIDVNECEHFLKVNLDRDLRSTSVWMYENRPQNVNARLILGTLRSTMRQFDDVAALKRIIPKQREWIICSPTSIFSTPCSFCKQRHAEHFHIFRTHWEVKAVS